MADDVIKIRIDQAALKKSVTLRELFAAQRGEMEAIIRILSRFVFSGDENLSPECGRDVILDMTIEQLEAATGALRAGLQDAAVPPLSAAT